jgi:hypothetical protein
MGIKWLKNSLDEGVASFYSSNITFSSSVRGMLENAYEVQVGFVDKNHLALASISKDELEKGALDASLLYKLEFRPSFVRICSSNLLKQIEEETGLKFSKKEAQKFRVYYDSHEQLVMIDLSGEVK